MMSPLVREVARRLVLGVAMLVGVSVLIFVGTQLLPGDVAQAVLGQSATPEALANLRKEMGLDQPAVTRYWHWFSNALTGDFGRSIQNRERLGVLPQLDPADHERSDPERNGVDADLDKHVLHDHILTGAMIRTCGWPSAGWREGAHLPEEDLKS